MVFYSLPYRSNKIKRNIKSKYYKNGTPKKKKLYFAKKTIEDGQFIDQTYSFIKCYFKTTTNIRNFVYKLKAPIFFSGIGKLQLKSHEMEANPILQFICMSSLKPASWFTFRGKQIDKEEQESLCDHEYHISFQHVSPLDNQGKVPARPLILSFDIEVNSNNPNVFPQASQPEDKVFQISCVFGRNGETEEKYDKYLLTLCKNKKGEIVDLNMDKLGDGIEVLGYETESDLLEGFKDLIIEKILK